jgi:hypothetical protein
MKRRQFIAGVGNGDHSDEMFTLLGGYHVVDSHLLDC